MTDIKARFDSEIIAPWDTLNHVLTEPVVIQPGRSEFVIAVEKMAAALRRIAEDGGQSTADLSQNAAEIALVFDIAINSKKSLFASASKKSSLSVISQFEADGLGKYKFLRNAVNVENSSAGRQDMMSAILKAANHLAEVLAIDIDFAREIAESKTGFESQVVIHAAPDAGPSGSTVNIQFLKRDANGDLVRYDPQNWDLNLLPARSK